MIETNNENIQLSIERIYKAPIKKVFCAWTDPESLKQWFCPGEMSVPFAEVDLKVGGKFRICMKNSENAEENPGAEYIAFGVYKSIEADQKLVMSWAWEGPESHESQLSIFFEDVNGDTKVRMLHERFSSENERDHHNEGWQGCFNNFESFLSGNSRQSTSSNTESATM